jgi:chromate transporter
MLQSEAELVEAGPPSLSPSAIFFRFLRFGLMAWGGPVAQIAMIRRELVDEERWISSSRFNRLLAVYQVLPGPEAHELAVHMGMLAGRRVGGFLAGLGFMLPGFVLMMALSWLYLSFDFSDSRWSMVLLGVQIGVTAMIVRAVHRIGGHILVDRQLWAIGIISAAATMIGVSFWLILPAAGSAYVIAKRGHQVPALLLLLAALVLGNMLGGSDVDRSAALGSTTSHGQYLASWWAIFLSGLKAGLLTFGGAYTAIPFLRDDTVSRGWITDAQFLDGIALSGVLPAPLIIFSTFVGYVAGGPVGAIAMTAGIFLPAFTFTLVFYDRLEKVIENDALHEFFDGIAAGVVGIIAVTAGELILSMAPRLPSLVLGAVIFLAALAVLYLWKSKLNVLVVILLSGVFGWLLFPWS